MAYTREENRINTHYKEALDEIEKLNELIKRRNEEIRNLKSKVSKLETEIITSSTDEDIIKKILSLFARNNSFLEIFDRLKYSGFRDITLEYIKEICTKREDLESELIEYYKKEEKAYHESLTINVDSLIDRNRARIERLYSEAELKLHECDTLEQSLKVMDYMKNLVKESNGTLKNKIDDDKEVDSSITILKETMNDYEENLNNVVRLTVNPSEIKTMKNIN